MFSPSLEEVKEIAKNKEKKFSILTQKEKEDLKNILSKITYSFI